MSDAPSPRRRASGLAFRIYLAGLAQVAAVLLGFVVLVRARAASDRADLAKARASVDTVVAQIGDDAAVLRELARVVRDEDATIFVIDDEGQVLANSRQEGDAPSIPLPPPSGDRPPMGRPPLPPPGIGGSGLFGSGPRMPVPGIFVPVHLPDGRRASALYSLRSPASASTDALVVGGLVLVIVGVASLLTARSLARPLARLAGAARDFGAGKLTARAGLARGDEIGDVAAAFDEMAARVTSLIHAEKELLANVSHELRTPLARIRVALDLAQEGDAETARVSLAEIGEDLGELERLIADVLDAARLEIAGPTASRASPPLRRESVDVAALLGRASSRFRSAHPTRPLVVNVEPDIPELSADAVLLRRVLDNLLENADRYATGADDEVTLVARRTETEIVIEVRDRGIGISEDDLPHVFQPFFRADRSRTRATGGLGLGLTLAHRIVEAHGGTIVLESRLGDGTTARIRLPLPPDVA